MKKLFDGIHKFQKHVFSTKQGMFEKLAEGQHPLALFITCSDSRINPHLLTQTEPGELFVLRNAGNIVPAYRADDGGGEAATIEYAVNVLGVQHIIVCGHSHCGAMSGLLDMTQLDQLPAVRSWLSHCEPVLKILDEKDTQYIDAAARLMATVEGNVVVQLEHLRTHPAVAEAIKEEKLNLHGWVYKFESGQVFGCDSSDGRFVPIGRALADDV